MPRPTASFLIVNLKGNDIAEETIHFIQVNHKNEKPKIVRVEAEGNLQKAEFNFKVELKTAFQKSSVDPKLLQLKISPRKNQEERAPKEFSPFSTKLAEWFGSPFAGEKNVIHEEIKKQVVDALPFGHPGSTKVLAESYTFCWAGIQKDIKEKCSTCISCMSYGKNIKHQLPMTKKSIYLYWPNRDKKYQPVVPVNCTIYM